MDIKNAGIMAWDLMRKHGLMEWSFQFDRSVRRFGQCDYGKKRISLSMALTSANDESAVRDTVLHEIAHAKTGRGAGHGPLWRSMALAIGCNGKRTYSAVTTVLPALPWSATCPKCGYVRQYARLKRSMVACARCCRTYNGGRFTPAFAFRWTKTKI